MIISLACVTSLKINFRIHTKPVCLTRFTRFTYFIFFVKISISLHRTKPLAVHLEMMEKALKDSAFIDFS